MSLPVVIAGLHFLAAAIVSPQPPAIPTVGPQTTEVVRPSELLTLVFTGALAVATFLLALFTRRLQIATALVATKTGELANQTTDLVRETLAGLSQADRHHEQALEPLIVPSVDAARGRTVDSISLYVSNIGVGPALDCFVSIEEWDGTRCTVFGEQIGPIGLNQDPIPVTVRYRGGGEVGPMGAFFLVQLDYRTLFQKRIRSMWATEFRGETAHAFLFVPFSDDGSYRPGERTWVGSQGRSAAATAPEEASIVPRGRSEGHT